MDRIKQIEEVLNKKKVTQTKLAELLNVNLTTVNNWFRRQSIPLKYEEEIIMLFNLKNETNIQEIKSHSITNKDLNTIRVSHINDNNRLFFSLDKSLIGLKDLNKIRFNIDKATNKNIHIIDLSVDNFRGDGIYYIKYPHDIVYKRIVYDPYKKNYNISDIYYTKSFFEAWEFNFNIYGKVIISIEYL